MSAAHTRDVAAALKQFYLGVSPASQMAQQKVVTSALADSTSCSTPFFVADLNGSLSMCPWAGRLDFVDDNDERTTSFAESQPILDALLSRQHIRAWTRVPESGSWHRPGVRQVATRHFVTNRTACQGGDAAFFRVFMYCGSPDGLKASSVALRHVQRPRLATTSTTSTSSTTTAAADDEDYEMLSSSSSAPSIAAANRPFAKCQYSIFAELPALCAHHPYGERGPQRLGPLLHHLFESRSGFVISDSNERALTYGELSIEGMPTVLDALAAAAAEIEGQRSAADGLQSSEIIVDVGSGVGKFVLAVALLSPSASAVGLEVQPERHARAIAALDEASAKGLMSPSEVSRVRFELGDATQEGVLPAGTTLAFLSNLCFSPELNMRVVARLLRLRNLKCVASLRELEPLQTALAGAEAHGSNDDDDGPSGGTSSSSLGRCGALVLVRSLRIGMSWDSRTRVYVYCCRHQEPL